MIVCGLDWLKRWAVGIRLTYALAALCVWWQQLRSERLGDSQADEDLLEVRPTDPHHHPNSPTLMDSKHAHAQSRESGIYLHVPWSIVSDPEASSPRVSVTASLRGVYCLIESCLVVCLCAVCVIGLES